jgi:hypothetical protein
MEAEDEGAAPQVVRFNAQTARSSTRHKVIRGSAQSAISTNESVLGYSPTIKILVAGPVRIRYLSEGTTIGVGFASQMR